MYSESDIEAAVAAGALTPEAARALRDSVAASREAPGVDEESFRLVTGFNDIFVTIAAILLLVALGWIGTTIGASLAPSPDQNGNPHGFLAGFRVAYSARMAVGGGLVAAASWLLAEYFTRRRRMALPSIVLLASFALAVSSLASALGALVAPDAGPRGGALVAAFAALVTAGASYAHWRRFHVPITIAALTLALAWTLVSLVLAAVPGARAAWLWAVLLAGIGVFAFAMRWDMSDRTRITRRSDVAFWLHLAAAPMIAHSIFNLIGVLGQEIGLGTVLAVVLLYGLFGLVALAVDRRALLVSGLLYVGYALYQLFQRFGAVSLNVALAILVVSSALLLLSAFWHDARRRVVAALPAELAARLPALDRPVPARA